MSEEMRVFGVLLALPQCVEVDPDDGFKKALLNLLNGMVIQVPKSEGFSMMGNFGKKPNRPATANCLMAGLNGSPSSSMKMLAGNEDLQMLISCWTSQASAVRAGNKA